MIFLRRIVAASSTPAMCQVFPTSVTSLVISFTIEIFYKLRASTILFSMASFSADTTTTYEHGVRNRLHIGLSCSAVLSIFQVDSPSIAKVLLDCTDCRLLACIYPVGVGVAGRLLLWTARRMTVLDLLSTPSYRRTSSPESMKWFQWPPSMNGTTTTSTVNSCIFVLAEKRKQSSDLKG
jgi:hypothetical protein